MFGKKSSEPKIVFASREPICEVENCNAYCFRGGHLCQLHFGARVEELQRERAKDEEKMRKLMNRDDWPEIWARGIFQGSNRNCVNCGTYGLHIVREKSREKRPKHPNSYWEVLEVICQDCVDGGR